jgi:hypothetical protein
VGRDLEGCLESSGTTLNGYSWHLFILLATNYIPKKTHQKSSILSQSLP